MPALVRYVECKCLVGGVTTSQGMELFSNAGARRYYRGIVRNVEQTDEPDLPEAVTRIADVDAKSRTVPGAAEEADVPAAAPERGRRSDRAKALPRAAAAERRMGDHLGARRHPLRGAPEGGLRIFGDRDASMVWSPMSNLLLYGATSRVKSARENGVRIGLGSDWAVSGSKNLLGELKVARLASDDLNTGFTDRELVAMATRDAAPILGWQNVLGSLRGRARAPISSSSTARQRSLQGARRRARDGVSLVMINGVARFGTSALMTKLATQGERVTIGGRHRMLFLNRHSLTKSSPGSRSGKPSKQLVDALKRLPDLAAYRE